MVKEINIFSRGSGKQPEMETLRQEGKVGEQMYGTRRSRQQDTLAVSRNQTGQEEIIGKHDLLCTSFYFFHFSGFRILTGILDQYNMDASIRPTKRSNMIHKYHSASRRKLDVLVFNH
jgi:hypothetical protein